MAARVCRVVPDVVALDRDFDYSVPDDLAPQVRVGTIVRVSLHGRRVRGWVVADGVESETPPERLLPLIGVVSEGPPADMVALSAWASHRYAGSRIPLLRSASPPNRVAVAAGVGAGGVGVTVRSPPRRAAVASGAAGAADRDADAVAAGARQSGRALVRWPPLLDRRRLVAGLISEEGSTVVVTADGARSEALVRWLRRCGHDAVLMRGEDPASVRTAAWRRARGGGLIVVGGRLAAPAPVPDLRVAIVVDDADEALKEERTPTWHARDLLMERAARAGAHFVIVSAAPTLVSLAVAGPAVLPTRAVEISGWPRVEVVDRRAEPPGSGLFSERLAEAIRRTLSGGSFAVCVLNRRGRARILACGACGKLVRRDRSGAPVWRLPADLATAVGGESSGRVCPHCGAIALRALRSGVTRVREEIAALLPRTEVAEVDASTGEIPDAAVLVGTEAVLHRAEVRRRRPTLVAYLDFDQELLAARFGAAEQAMWLLVRGAHLLAGRSRSETRLLVQTRLPQHRVLESAVGADPGRLAESERRVREAAGLPPFAALAELSGDEAAVSAAVAALRAQAATGRDVSVLGQMPAGSGARALVRSSDSGTLADALADALPAGRSEGRLRCNVDPLRA